MRVGRVSISSSVLVSQPKISTPKPYDKLIKLAVIGEIWPAVTKPKLMAVSAEPLEF